jgi:hypothetical protein
MIRTERLRAYLLDVGDEFIMVGTHYKVVAKDDNFIQYRTMYEGRISGTLSQISSASRMIIELVTTKDNKLIADSSSRTGDWIADDKIDEADVPTSSQTNTKPNVSGSVCDCKGMYSNIEIEKNECWLCGLPIKQTDA